MQFENFTPWPHLLFERADTDDRRFMVLALQATFAIRSGAALEPARDQPDVVAADEYRGDPQTTSLLRAGVIATYKPSSDVTVEAIARSPEPKAEWPVRLQVGAIASSLRVRGPHEWRHDDDQGWTKSEPEPCKEVPIVYERAFGGSFHIDGELVEETRNPVGTGFLPDELEDHSPRPAPQIVATDEPEHEAGGVYRPRGWAPIPSYFSPRREHIGTADETWRKTRWPRPPRDFDDAYYQCAHPDLIYPGHLRGDEAIRIEGVTADGAPIVSQLPGWCVFLLLRIEGGRMVMHPARLDHLHLDVSAADRDEHLATLTWRAVFPKAPEIWRAETRMMPMDQRAQRGAAA
jgi:hypothetical protein